MAIKSNSSCSRQMYYAICTLKGLDCENSLTLISDTLFGR